MSLLVAPMGPLSEFFYLRDYWRPELFNGWPIGLEDLLFAFLIGGIASVIYEEFFGRQYVKRQNMSHLKWMPVFAFFGVAWMIGGNIFLGFNSIYVSSLGFLIIGMLMIFLRRDLFVNALLSGLLVAGIMFAFYLVNGAIFGGGIVQRWWLLQNISGIIIFGAPIEELLWGFGWGFLAGPVYEFVNGLKAETKGKGED